MLNFFAKRVLTYCLSRWMSKNDPLNNPILYESQNGKWVTLIHSSLEMSSWVGLLITMKQPYPSQLNVLTDWQQLLQTFLRADTLYIHGNIPPLTNTIRHQFLTCDGRRGRGGTNFGDECWVLQKHSAWYGIPSKNVVSFEEKVANIHCGKTVGRNKRQFWTQHKI